MRRPLVAIPGRFSASASALRYGALVNAQALLRMVFAAGGEPVTLLPHAPGGVADPAEVADRLAFADAVLLPGGADVDPTRYGQQVASTEVYDVDAEQDGFDLAVARYALDRGVPLLAICRGLHVVNVVEGGSLVQHMDAPHRHVVHEVGVVPGSRLAGTVLDQLSVSCYHHQEVDRLGASLAVTARATDGTVEAVERPGSAGWFLGLQWHPEDTYRQDERQASIVKAFLAAS